MSSRDKCQKTNKKNASTKLILEPFLLLTHSKVYQQQSRHFMQVICLGLKIIPSSVPFYCSNQDKYKRDSFQIFEKDKKRFIYLMFPLVLTNIKDISMSLESERFG